MNTSTLSVFIREASYADAPAINEIYNDEVLHGVATFDTEVKSLDERVEWLKAHDFSHPVFVACIDSDVVGWASLSKWSNRAAYDLSAEISVYVHSAHRGKKIGKLLFDHLLQEARLRGLHCLISRITEGNHISIQLHLKAGFNSVGTLHEIGYKFGNFLNVVILEKIIQ